MLKLSIYLTIFLWILVYFLLICYSCHVINRGGQWCDVSHDPPGPILTDTLADEQGVAVSLPHQSSKQRQHKHEKLDCQSGWTRADPLRPAGKTQKSFGDAPYVAFICIQRAKQHYNTMFKLYNIGIKQINKCTKCNLHLNTYMEANRQIFTLTCDTEEYVTTQGCKYHWPTHYTGFAF